MAIPLDSTFIILLLFIVICLIIQQNSFLFFYVTYPTAPVIKPTPLSITNSLNPQSESLDLLKPKIITKPLHCFVNIYGFTHSGTGLLHLTAVDSVKTKASWFENTTARENEGNRLQSALPLVPNHPDCLSNLNVTIEERYFICPNIQTCNSPQLLFQEWSKYWDLTKFYLFQKSPTFKLQMISNCLLLSSEQATTQVHLISLRHPLFWRIMTRIDTCELKFNFLCSLLGWLRVWGSIISEEFYNIKNVFILRFESLIQNPKQVLSLVNLPCQCGEEESSCWTDTRRRRELKVRQDGIITTSFMYSSNVLREWEACLKQKSCRNCLLLAEEEVNLFGYTLLNTTEPIIQENNKHMFQSQYLKKNMGLNFKQSAQILAESKYCLKINPE